MKFKGKGLIDMKHRQRVAYAHEALDRIHVVQTLLSSILVDVDRHKGLCDNSAEALDTVSNWLQEAYMLQSDYLFDLKEKGK
jgi:hypothetical protein